MNNKKTGIVLIIFLVAWIMVAIGRLYWSDHNFRKHVDGLEGKNSEQMMQKMQESDFDFMDAVMQFMVNPLRSEIHILYFKKPVDRYPYAWVEAIKTSHPGWSFRLIHPFLD